MKTLWRAAVYFILAGMARAADPVYARIQVASAQATLENGKQFNAAQGDCFPLLGYDGAQTMMHLQFGPQSFWVQKEDAAPVPASNTVNAAAQYNNELAKLQAITAAPTAAQAPDKRTIDAIAQEIAAPLRTMIRQEMMKASGDKSQEIAKAFPVDASSDAWQNSGVRVKAGQKVTVEAVAGEKWDVGWGPIDAKGYPAEHDSGAGIPLYHTGRANDDWHWGALICAVGDGRNELSDPGHQIEIGTRRSFTVDADGYVYLMANDNPQLPDGRNGFDDNSGIIHVNVTVIDQPATNRTIVAPGDSPGTSAGVTPESVPAMDAGDH
jgi:hypothetical protein